MASTSTTGGVVARPARRIQAPSWRDARLLVGIALLLAATVLGSLVVARARATTSVLVLTRAVPAGQRITTGDLGVADVRLGAQAGHYLPASRRPAGDAVAARDLHAGDLLPADAVARGDEVARRRVVVPVRDAVASALVRGSTVEVWVSARSMRSGTETFAAPRKVLSGAVVAQPRVGSSTMAGADSASVALWVPGDSVAGLLAAVDAKSGIALVPQPGSPVGDAS